MEASAQQAIQRKYEVLGKILDERGRRFWAAAEAGELGRGGVSLVARATGLSRTTIYQGMAELQQGGGSRTLAREHVRAAGGGRRRLTEKDPQVLTLLKQLVEPTTRGDPESPLRWTCKSTRQLADVLREQGHPVGRQKICELLGQLGYSLQANRKTHEGSDHADRDAQFEYINAQVKAHQDLDQPVISVDTKKKELVGDFKNAGRDWRPKGEPQEVRTHDFMDRELGKVNPYGVYDQTANTGWVSVGTDHDTAEFAVETIRRWWLHMGSGRYPNARELLITADGGGSNGYRLRLWKVALQGFANTTGLTVRVCHFPPGTSKWNKIEHRMFSFISLNWRGQELCSNLVYQRGLIELEKAAHRCGQCGCQDTQQQRERCAMRDATSRRNPDARGGEDRQRQQDEVGLPLEELVRRGAREILQRAIEAEVEATLEEFASVSLSDGRRAVVRNGYLPARAILTTVGSVEVQVPKVRDRSGAGVKFNSALAPPYVRRSARVAAALPWLYLKGISSGDLGEALAVLVGEDAKGLSPAALGRLKAEWSEEYQGWTRRDLTGKQYAYWWADGIYTTLRESDAPKLCLLVIIGVTADGTKEWVAIHDGLRESTESWLDVLRDLKERGLEAGPRLAVGDGALGFWKALDQVYPNTVHQRCWFHKLGNVLTDLPKSLQSKAKADLQAIWRAPTRKQAQQAFKRFINRYEAKYPKATEKLTKDREALLAFFDFPAEHWVHLRTTNPIESTFATVRHRTSRTKNCVTRSTFLGLAFKLAEEAAKTWRRIRAPEKVAELLGGARYEDGIRVPDDPPDAEEEQREAA